MKKKTARVLGSIVFIVGVLLFVFIGAISIWGDIEATFFDASLIQAKKLGHLNCPAVITSNETSEVTAKITNVDQRPVIIEVKAHVTDGFVTLMNEYKTDVSLEPGQSNIVDIPIAPENAAYGRLILVRVHQMKELTNPYQNASCGVVLVNIPFLTGNQFVILVMSLGILLTVGGLFIWALNSRPIILQRKRGLVAMIVFAAIAILLAIIGLAGFWLFGVFIAAVWLLMGIGLIWQFFSAPDKDKSITAS
jgi:hypothetical protein